MIFINFLCKINKGYIKQFTEVKMKKNTIIYILIFTITFTSILYCTDTNVNAAKNNHTAWPAVSSIYAESAILMEASTGTILYDKECNKKMYPASITKIMTALLTIEHCSLDETVTFSENAINSLSYDDANIACQVGEKMSVKDCLYALMLSSANEVATALGEHIAGSVSKFADMMNERAKQAGAKNTHFVNANGLHDTNHYVTAYDMAMITRAAAKYPLFNEIVNSTTYTIKKNNKRKESVLSYQRHKMVWPTSGYYYDGIIGGKTGYTDQSGTTLVTYAKRNGMTIIAVVLKSNGNNVYTDTKLLLDYGFNNFNLVNVSKNDSRFSENSATLLQSPFCTSRDCIYIDKESNVVIPKTADFSQLTAKVDFKNTEDSFATISYTFDNRSVGTALIKYESVDCSEVKSEEKDVPVETTVVTAQKDNSKDSDTTFNIFKFLIPIAIILVIIIILVTFFTIQKRRLERIRAIKRNRKR